MTSAKNKNAAHNRENRGRAGREGDDHAHVDNAGNNSSAGDNSGGGGKREGRRVDARAQSRG